MVAFITLSCPSCGNKLQITEDIDRFACAACGNEHIVNRSGGIVTLKPVIDSIQKVQVGVDKTASELAIVRLSQEIRKLEKDIGDIMAQKGTLVIFSGVYLPVMLIIFVLGFLFVITEVRLLGWVMMIGILSFCAYAFLKGQNQHPRNEKEAKPLVDKLNNKKRELAEHQATVSKYK
jgi:ribosomal protein S27AE